MDRSFDLLALSRALRARRVEHQLWQLRWSPLRMDDTPILALEPYRILYNIICSPCPEIILDDLGVVLNIFGARPPKWSKLLIWGGVLSHLTMRECENVRM